MSENQQNNTDEVAGALPSGNEENIQRLQDQPRQPMDLQGLLRFAMEATKAEDASGHSEYAPMDDARRQFLEEALSSLTVDMTEVVRSAIKTLTDEETMRKIQLGDAVPKDVHEAFENLLELVDDIDIANDFYKLGGFIIFPICFDSENESIRALASGLLGEVCQNNPFCQSKALESGLVNVMLTLVQSENGAALAKAIFALSSACRDYEPACKEFVAQGGCEIISDLLLAEDSAARTKAAFFTRHLCYNYAPAKEKFIKLNLANYVATHIKMGRDSTTEHLLSVIVALLENGEPAVIRQCTDPELGFKSILEDHLKHPDLEDDCFREEKEYCTEILSILATSPQVENLCEEADR